MALLDRAIVQLLPAVPRPIVRSVSSRYIAGDALADATRTVHALKADCALLTMLTGRSIGASASKRLPLPCTGSSMVCCVSAERGFELVRQLTLRIIPA